jgi:replication-associated recombination protein RarA
MSREDQTRVGIIAGTAFSPGAPVRDKDVFAGRTQQIRRVIDAISQHGKSVLIYGERGVGKTSLANVVDEFFLSVANARIFAPHIACDTEDSFHKIWHKVIAEKNENRP